MSESSEAFDRWFYEVEQYATRAERFFSDVELAAQLRHPPFATETHLSWLKAAFEQGALYERQKTAK